MHHPVFMEAKHDFEEAINGATDEELKKCLPGFGIGAMRFAKRYIDPNKNNELYKRIYNIYFDFFLTLSKNDSFPKRFIRK